MPRRVLVVYDSKAKGHVYFREFVKPVLDAGALDYKTFDTAPGAAYDVAHELQNAQGNVDGIVAISTSLFREIVNGMADRIAEKGDSAAIPIAFVPMPHLYGLAKLVGFFADASTMKLMGFPALSIVHGATRPINERDIDHAEQFADKRVDRRRALSEPEKLFTVKRMALDGIQLMVPKADAQ